MANVLNAPKARNRTHQPLPVAERYGMLKVLMFVPKMGWLCKCDCGTQKYIEGNPLRESRHLSCGCNANKRQGQTLRATLRTQKKRQKTVRYKRVRHATHGTRCWVCRNKTGINEPVALCKICIRGCI